MSIIILDSITEILFLVLSVKENGIPSLLYGAVAVVTAMEVAIRISAA